MPDVLGSVIRRAAPLAFLILRFVLAFGVLLTLGLLRRRWLPARGTRLRVAATGALLIGVDLGPNLSVTGSLATILWLVALRREGQVISGWRFLGLGLIVMPPALLAALGSFVMLQVR